MLASFRAGGRGSLAAAFLCVLALVFNLLGSVAYAEARLAQLGAGGAADAFVCHAAAEPGQQPANDGKAQLPAKCPLCQVSAAAFAAPPQQPPALPLAPAVETAIRVPAAADAPIPLPAQARPGPRAPPFAA